LIVDGRNRLAACKIADVKPTFEKLNGQDPLAYIVSANLARRNLTKGLPDNLAACSSGNSTRLTIISIDGPKSQLSTFLYSFGGSEM
jgi:hypothetical protein